ncbi:uncharacterized protein H6S33_010973 [Morchella sextelata]|jgi:hypothetical protein|uniref:uncharacterized protein n=1 Tax=Morchella sextelata TaxID=1174677 RepID=UPI001D059362|nr:uncharacterized protein H6S33_010973 [Morchella sextelata]KAH0611708.1 hypothetical protein H6S33_010973 [Morchella sextelata]
MEDITTLYTTFKAAVDKYEAAVTALSANLDGPMECFDAAAARETTALGNAAWACHDECGGYVERVAKIRAEVGPELNGLLGRCFKLGEELRELSDEQ